MADNPSPDGAASPVSSISDAGLDNISRFEDSEMSEMLPFIGAYGGNSGGPFH